MKAWEKLVGQPVGRWAYINISELVQARCQIYKEQDDILFYNRIDEIVDVLDPLVDRRQT